MKPLFLWAAMALSLSACSALQQLGAPISSHPSSPAKGRQQTAPAPTAKSDALLREANRLADKVKSGELTRLAAADQLGAFRLKAVGSNPVDDNTFAMYRYLTVEREAGRIDQDTFRAKMDERLREWMRRWPKMNPKPADPAFTNFLLKLYGLPALGA